MNQLENTAGNSREAVVTRTRKLLKSFGTDERKQILSKADVKSVEITAEFMVAVKADLGIPLGKLKTIATIVDKNNETNDNFTGK